MIYEAWRISYQDAEQAAKAAFDLAAERWREQERLRDALIFAASWVATGKPLDGLVDRLYEAAKYKVPNG